MFKKKARNKKPICKNCSLFDPKSNLCGIVICHNNTRFNLPVEPNDLCFFLEEIKTKDGEVFTPEVQQVKMYTVDPITEERSTHGTVKIEAPEEFFN